MKPNITRWLAHAGPGAACIYHQGYLALDRRSDELPQAETALRLAREGLVFLTQRRLGSRHYEYIATKASRPLPELTWTLAYDE